MAKILLMVAFLCGLLSAPASASETYLCVADMATGFAFDESQKEWHSTDFNTDNKYVVSKAKSGRYAWVVATVGKTTMPTLCNNGFNADGILVCREGHREFRMNKSNLRFLTSFLFGYWTDLFRGSSPGLFKEGDSTPNIEIGKCNPLYISD